MSASPPPGNLVATRSADQLSQSGTRKDTHRELRLLVLASKRPGLAPCQRYRFEQWATRLERDHAVKMDLMPFESPALSDILYEPGHLGPKAAWISYDFLRRLKVFPALKHYDAVVIHREAALIGPAIYERLMAWTGKPIIFDFDDGIWMPQPDHGTLFSLLHFHSKTATICRLATAVSAGNRILADYARQFNSAVSVVPSTIELDEYRVMPEAPLTDKFVVCWTGSSSTLVYFEQARSALEQVAKHVPLVVKVICSKPPSRPIAGAELQFVPWRADGEAEEVGTCHVGIMPLPDNEFTRGKCAMKALQYMATGRPVVVSPVGVNVDVVRNGENGFLAATEREFAIRLLELARSSELRMRLGLAARRTVETAYSAPTGAAKFASIVKSVIACRAN